jgi:serine/threonine protein kinase
MLEVQLLDAVGAGASGTVYKALLNQEIVACKVLHQQNYSQHAISAFKREALLMQKIVHPRILLFRGFFHQNLDIGIVMEYMDSSLFHALVNLPRFDQSRVYNIAHDVACALNYLHSLGICHHDLKPENVFLDSASRAKVGDFGLSVIRHESKSAVSVSACAGTAKYLGPECFGVTGGYPC